MQIKYLTAAARELDDPKIELTVETIVTADTLNYFMADPKYVDECAKYDLIKALSEAIMEKLEVVKWTDDDGNIRYKACCRVLTEPQWGELEREVLFQVRKEQCQSK